MKLRFRGVRGSIPTPGKNTVKFGGNTTCLQITRDTGPVIVIDAGTGIRALGEDLMRDPGPPFDIKILVTHTHHDHIHGFPFFIPIYIPGGKIGVYGVGPIHQGVSFEKVMRDQMTYSYFPVENTMIDGVVHYYDFHEMFADRPSGVEGSFDLCDGVVIKLKLMNHPVYTVGYRIEADGQSLVFTGDHEPYFDTFADASSNGDDDEFDFITDEGDTSEFVDLMNERFVQFCTGADLLVIDTQYTKAEYFGEGGMMPKKTWGHGYYESSIDLGSRASVKKMAFTHHDPARPDDQLLELEKKAQKYVADQGMDMQVFCSREDMIIDLAEPLQIPD